MDLIALAAAFAWFIYVEYVDAKVSKYYPLHTTGEANWWARGKDGYFSMAKSVRNTAIVGGALLATAFLPVKGITYGVAGTVALIATGIWSVVHNNRKKQRSDFAKQADTLEHFSTNTVTLTNIKMFSKGRQTYWVFANFYDIRVPVLPHEPGNGEVIERQRALPILTAKIAKLAARPELWQDLERAKKI